MKLLPLMAQEDGIKLNMLLFRGIKPTIVILLLMNVGNVLNAGFEIQYLLGNGLIQKFSQTIDIYVLKWGISREIMQ